MLLEPALGLKDGKMTPGTAPTLKEAAEVCLPTAGRLANELPAEPTALCPSRNVICLLGLLEILLRFFPELCPKFR